MGLQGQAHVVAVGQVAAHPLDVVLKQPTRTLGEQRHGVLFGLAADGV